MSNGVPSRADSVVAPPAKGAGFAAWKPFLAPILISCILTVGHFWYGILDGQGGTGTLLAILSAIALEIVLSKYATGKWPRLVFLSSCYITGISVGIIVRSNYLWPYVACSWLSISSKYALRIKNRHLWNPSNLGVSLMLLLTADQVAPLSQQWGNDIWVPTIILTLGALILFSLGRLHISLTYVAAFIVLSWGRSLIQERPWISEVALLTAPAYMLFICFMITDPKTTTCTKGRRCAVAVLVAVVETIFRLNDVIHAPYYALFIVAPATNLAEIWWESRRQAQIGASMPTPTAATACSMEGALLPASPTAATRSVD
jgi:enediyne biosynthesis protein E5